jgi:hypothetical protein
LQSIDRWTNGLTAPLLECGHADIAAAADSTRMPLRRAHEQAWVAGFLAKKFTGRSPYPRGGAAAALTNGGTLRRVFTDKFTETFTEWQKHVTL